MILFFNKPLATWLWPMGDKLYFYDQELTTLLQQFFQHYLRSDMVKP
ncbi:hypothetical protein [Leptothoe kymatousa]|uniref:Uncharacterized protein n=1 Tax=Leptothoe kymatousa TAU-MAC 1615 TaxID=2364775 RepID=A0ABS5Y0E8_9CYAN|nr:hypothetical protein [Leptothoe kymatousa]MBT9311291.1 hypothetical protein [Leptothoe kymatousa TAU-MAC 1615]